MSKLDSNYAKVMSDLVDLAIAVREEQEIEAKGFTGEITDALGRVFKYVDGERVKRQKQLENAATDTIADAAALVEQVDMQMKAMGVGVKQGFSDSKKIISESITKLGENPAVSTVGGALTDIGNKLIKEFSPAFEAGKKFGEELAKKAKKEYEIDSRAIKDFTKDNNIKDFQSMTRALVGKNLGETIKKVGEKANELKTDREREVELDKQFEEDKEKVWKEFENTQSLLIGYLVRNGKLIQPIDIGGGKTTTDPKEALDGILKSARPDFDKVMKDNKGEIKDLMDEINAKYDKFLEDKTKEEGEINKEGLARVRDAQDFDRGQVIRKEYATKNQYAPKKSS